MTARRKSKKAKVEVEEEEEEDFHVEVVLSARVGDNEEWEYLVKWYGYDKESDNTWEPQSGIEGSCRRLLASFWKEVGTDDHDYVVGYTETPSESWIKKEKQYFRKFLKEDEKKNGAMTREEEELTLPKGPYQDRKRVAPLIKRRKQTSETKKRSVASTSRKRKRSRDESESDESDDLPLATQSKKRIRKQQEKPAKTRIEDASGKPRPLSEEDLPDDLKFDDMQPDVPEEEAKSSVPVGKPKLHLSTDSTSFHNTSANASAPRPPSAIGSTSALPGRSSLGTPTPTISQTTTPNIPSFTPTIVSRPPKSTVPAHRQPGRVKQISFAEMSSTTVSGNATKQRIAQGLPASPVIPSPSTIPPNISFQKRKPSDNSAASASFKSPAIPSTASPISTYQNTDSVAPMYEVDNFLDSVEIDAPRRSHISPPAPVQEGPVLKSMKPVLNSIKFRKHFSWTGEITCSFGNSTLKQHSRVTISEISSSSADCLQMNRAFPPYLQSLEFTCFHHVSDISRQVMKMDRKFRLGEVKPEPTSQRLVVTLAQYTAKHSMVLAVPTPPMADGAVEGLLIFFPLTSPLRKTFRSTGTPSSSTQLLVVLVPSSFPILLRKRPAQSGANLVTNPFPGAGNHMRYALNVLKYPDWVHSFMASRKQDFCIWHDASAKCTEPGKSRLPYDNSRASFETRMLANILNRYEGKNVGYRADVAVVFVHVSALRTLHHLPAFSERIWKRVDILFVTYGTHYSFPPSMWGFDRIYRTGGRVTFSPIAFMEDPMKVFDAALNIAQHRLWSVWLSPEVLGYLARACYQDPLSVFDDGTFVFGFLLDTVHNGIFSFGQPPPAIRSIESPKVQDWLTEQAAMVAGGPRDILEFSLRMFDAKYANMPSGQWDQAITDNLYADVRASQLHPTLIQEYRRFLILCTEKEVNAHLNEPFEFRTPDSFEFSYKSGRSRQH